MVKVEGRDVRIYTQDQSYYAKKRLYEIKEQASFVQIAKGILINGEYLDSIEPGLSGTMRIRLKNGLSDCVSRHYLPAFKKYLGL